MLETRFGRGNSSLCAILFTSDFVVEAMNYLEKENNTERGRLFNKPYYFEIAAKRKKVPALDVDLYYKGPYFEEWNDHWADYRNESLSIERRVHHFDMLGSIMFRSIDTSFDSYMFKRWMEAGGV